jgi:hypothetical protein
MPDLGTDPVTHWLAAKSPSLAAAGPGPFRPLEADPEITSLLAALGTALDKARDQDPDDLSNLIASDPGRDILRGITAQLGTPRMARLLAWLAEPDMPRREALLRALFAPDPTGSGQAIRAALRALNRPILFSRFFGEDRIDALISACHSLATEPA